MESLDQETGEVFDEEYVCNEVSAITGEGVREVLR